MTKDTIQEEQEIDEVDNLLFSIVPEPRVFILANKNETTLMGILEEEEDDSFLVSTPSRLISHEDGTNEVVPFVPVPYLRLMKFQVLCVAPMMEPFKTEFDLYLDKESDIVEASEKQTETTTQTSEIKEDLVTYLDKAYDEGRIHLDTTSTKH